MTFINSFQSYIWTLACLLIGSIPTLALGKNSALQMNAMIANKGLGCQMNLSENTLQFRPLQSSQLTGGAQTYQIQPLRVQLTCSEEQQTLLPTLTIEGVTPYSNDQQKVIFLNGKPNGVGFMLRQAIDENTISLADFYQPDQAISQGSKKNVLTTLDKNNNYQSETLLWVGLVGPFQPEITPGNFNASLTLNVVFD